MTNDEMDVIMKSNITYKCNLKVKRDDGSIMIIPSYRVQHNHHVKPCKGGIILNEEVHQEEIEGLAIIMGMKASVLSLPFSGAKGGIRINPEKISLTELERVIRTYTMEYAVRGILSPSSDVPAPDFNCG